LYSYCVSSAFRVHSAAAALQMLTLDRHVVRVRGWAPIAACCVHALAHIGDSCRSETL
jgi:hypothetical protein